MAIEGMDVDLAHTQLGQLQTHGVDPLQAALQQLNHLVMQISESWRGPDAARFHDDWVSVLSPQLTRVVDALHQFHTNFSRNIQEQVHASGGTSTR